MLSFSEKERMCEKVFEEKGPFWHIYTDGTKMPDIFCDEEDKKSAMSALAVAERQTTDAEIVTFEIMNNHLHFIGRGSKEGCLEIFDRFKQRVTRTTKLAGKVIDWAQFQAKALKIESLKALRNEIIYVNRNAFVASPQYTPFSYPWGGGCAYYSPFYNQLPCICYDDAGFDKWRKLTHCRDVSMLKDLKFVEDTVYIPSFCRTDIGEAMFHDARSYFNSLTRNAEAFSQIAERLKDSVFLTDDEMYSVAVRWAEKEFGNRQIALLSPEEKIRIAKELHFKYNGSNQQIRRILRLDAAVINELFPV